MPWYEYTDNNRLPTIAMSSAIDRLPCGHNSGAFRLNRSIDESETPFYDEDIPASLIRHGRCEVCKTKVDEIYGKEGWLIGRAIPR